MPLNNINVGKTFEKEKKNIDFYFIKISILVELITGICGKIDQGFGSPPRHYIFQSL